MSHKSFIVFLLDIINNLVLLYGGIYRCLHHTMRLLVVLWRGGAVALTNQTQATEAAKVE
jgi:hypothetical protein